MNKHSFPFCAKFYMYVYICIYVYVCIYIVYVYTHTHTHTHTHTLTLTHKQSQYQLSVSVSCSCVAGHLMGPVLCHSFCNYMGFPAISTVLEHPHRISILSSYLLGVFLFLLFLFPFTNPSYYGLLTPVCTLTPSPSSLCFSWSLLSHTPLLLSHQPWLMQQL